MPCQTGGLSVRVAAGTGVATVGAGPPSLTPKRRGRRDSGDLPERSTEDSRVLKLLADTDHGLTVTELSNKLGVNRTVFGLPAARHAGAARPGSAATCAAAPGRPRCAAARPTRPPARPGSGAARAALPGRGHRGHRPPHARRRQRRLAVAVSRAHLDRDYHVAYRAGFRHPLDRGAAGRAILSARQATECRSPRLHPHPRRTRSRRQRAAAPLVGVSGVEGSVGVVMLADAVPERVGPRVLDAAREVADALR